MTRSRCVFVLFVLLCPAEPVGCWWSCSSHLDRAEFFRREGGAVNYLSANRLASKVTRLFPSSWFISGLRVFQRRGTAASPIRRLSSRSERLSLRGLLRLNYGTSSHRNTAVMRRFSRRSSLAAS